MKFTKATVTSQNGPLLSDQIDTNLIFVMGFFAGAAHHKIRNADTKLRVFGYEKIIMNLKKKRIGIETYHWTVAIVPTEHDT